jgi:ribosomal protein S18 acetylase RimI-like enzyme
MEIQYDRLNAESVDQIIELQNRCWKYDRGLYILSSRAFIERAFQFSNFAFGAFCGDEMVGFIICSVPSRRASMNLGRHLGFTDEQLDQVGHANMMAIAPEYRRLGIGSKLFQMAMDAFPSQCEYIMTMTKLDNNLIRQLIESRGFRMVKTAEIAGHLRAIYVQYRIPLKSETSEWIIDRRT